MEADVTSRTLDELQDLYGSQGLSSLFEHLKPHARQAIALEPRPMSDSSVSVGGSRLGGLPDLPRGQDWFLNSSTGAPLNFVAQINLAEVAAVTNSPLPARGMLFFFYDAEAFGWGFEPEDRHGQRVFLFDGPMEELAQTPVPTGIDVYEPRSLTFIATTELPDVTSDLVDPDLDDDELSLDTKLLGHSNNVHEGMELTCELTSRGCPLACQRVVAAQGLRSAKARVTGGSCCRWTATTTPVWRGVQMKGASTSGSGRMTSRTDGLSVPGRPCRLKHPGKIPDAGCSLNRYGGG